MDSPAYMPVEKHELETIKLTPQRLDSQGDEIAAYPAIVYSGARSSSEAESATSPLKGKGNGKSGNKTSPWRSLPDLFKSLLLPFIAIGFLAFCYTVHGRAVPVSVSRYVNTSPDNIASIKAGITSISIIIITVGLWPLKSLIQELSSEEFFRALKNRRGGVPLSTLNRVSNPTFGFLDILKIITRQHVSPFLIAAFTAGLLSIAVSTLAPAALSADVALIDSGLMALSVGAITPSSVLNVTQLPIGMSSAVTSNTDQAASIAWAEETLGIRYSFQEAGAATDTEHYIVPTPSELSELTSAHWLTDVAKITPSCGWAKTNITQPMVIAGNFSSSNTTIPAISLPEYNIDLTLSGYTWDDYANYWAAVKLLDPTLSSYVNHTTQAYPTDGTVAWLLSRCVGNCGIEYDFSPHLHFDLSSVPTFTVSSQGSTTAWESAVLVCSSKPVIETREVRNDGQGNLSIVGNGTYTRQGNLHPSQTSALLSYVMHHIADDAGPSFRLGLIGTALQASLIFGKDVIKNVNTTYGTTTLAPAPLANITATYTRLLKSSSKIFMGSGNFGQKYVPGRISREQVIFSSSLPNIIASTILLVALSVLTVFAHFREGKGEQFTLFAVASSLHQSDIPERFVQLRMERSYQRPTEDELIKSLGGRVVSMSVNQDGTTVLHLD